MTPKQAIKKQILINNELITDSCLLSPDEIDDLYDEHLYEIDVEEFREGEVETTIPCDFSRHYESNSVAAQCEGQWVGWTYWYGGGKHGNPEEIEWMDDAYFCTVTEKEVLVTVQTFTKKA